MDERENGVEIANPNDRLSSSDIELNRLNSVQLIEKQNVNGTSREKTCISNSSHTRIDININAVASHVKEKLHLSSGLLNGYNCHADCHLNLNGVEGCGLASGNVRLNEKSFPRMCESSEPSVSHDPDDACGGINEKCCEESESNSVALCDNVSECQPSESDNYPSETLSETDISKVDNTKQRPSRCCSIDENSEDKAGNLLPAVETHYKCLCKNATTSNCATVKGEQLLNKSDHVCDDHSEEKGTDECSAVVISCEGPIRYVGYESENQMPDIMRLIQKDLSEPYSIYTYRYFIHNWPKLCFLAMDGEKCVGAIVCKLDMHKKHSKRGYIAMLAVDENYRKKKIGSNLVLKAIQAMIRDEADEVVLETEITNKPALRLYENLGFVRDKRLFRYYLNGVDALRLKLWLR